MLHAFFRAQSSLVPLLRAPNHRSEQVSEMLFGEKARLVELDSPWVKIRTAWDDYEGWCLYHHLEPIPERTYKKPETWISASHLGHILWEDQIQPLALGSPLSGIKSRAANYKTISGRFKGKRAKAKELTAGADQLVAAAEQYLYAPYRWGGRSIWGIDCSGLVQMSFRLCGLPIARDAAQQWEYGQLLDFPHQCQKGDLAFFGEEGGAITHVGIMVNEHQIIHSSEGNGGVFIDLLDAQGILNLRIKKRTHFLRGLRRPSFGGD